VRVKVLVDECVPLKLVRLLTGHAFSTAQQKGWDGFTNGKLLALAEPEFDLFLTSDRNLQYQQNLILLSFQSNINNPVKAGEGLDLGGGRFQLAEGTFQRVSTASMESKSWLPKGCRRTSRQTSSCGLHCGL